MDQTIKKIASGWDKNPGATAASVKQTEDQLNIRFPEDYVTFLLWSNGGEGNIGENYISLWKQEDIAILNREYKIPEYLSNLRIAIGTDGGGICFGFDFTKDAAIFTCPLGDLDPDVANQVSASFKDFIERCLKEEVFD
ncbi:SMI1/KNR4 family protein [Niabella hirudinis]|uniref:SMI1/KNR4 family protein n=1 Tax=Niabella hirudinis TaxID=1285929 RepID=UPI003EB72A4D